MSEYMKTITDDTIINYWMSFFLEIKNRHELEDLLNNISNIKIQDMLLQYKKVDTSIVKSMIWNDTEEQDKIQKALDKIDDVVLWGDFYEPVIKKYIKKLFDVIKESKIISDEESFISRCIEGICYSLHIPSFQTLIAETYYAKKNKLLKGETREDRGKYYNKVLLKDNEYRKEVYECYPELIRVLDVKTKNTIDFLVDIIKSTESELNNIEKSLNDSKSLGKIIDIFLGEGDTHNNGKTVTKLKFDSGKTVVYKPHNLEVEEKYYEFIQWLNKVSAKDETGCLMAARCYNGGNKGWMEFIEQKDCKNESEVKSFYYKIGKLLCILYTTDGIDIHNENIIAHGNMPVLVDLETFIHADLYPISDQDSASTVSIKKLNNSVIKNALLPTYIINKENKKVFDLGGLSGAENQEAAFASKFIKDYGTDEVKVILEHSIVEAKGNNASLKGKTMNSKEYLESIVSGFKDTYNWIIENKAQYIRALKELFQKVTVRILFKPTNSYSHLLSSSYHPNLLTNSIDRFIYLHKYAEKVDKKYNKLVLSEVENLLRGDIPYFSVKVNEKKVYGSGSNDAVYLLEKAAIDSIQSKIDDMNTIDLNRQAAIIRTKLFTKISDTTTKTEFQKCDTVKKSQGENFIEAAEKIADFLLERSVTGMGKEGKNRTWFGCEENEYHIYEYITLNDSIYYGLSGIAIFFNYLEKLSKKDKYKNITKEICDTIIQGLPSTIEEFDKSNLKLKDIDAGAFSGISGSALLLSYIDKSNNEKKYENVVSVMLELVNRKLDYNITADVIGHIGALGCMISMYYNSPYSSVRNRALEIAKNIYKKIKDKWIVIEGRKGVTWTKKGYSGYAHGNAGVVAQLSRLYKITGEEEIKDLIDKSLLYEREMYVEEEKNWLRAIDENYCFYGWCHGVPGILLSRIQLIKNGYKDELFSKEVQIAKESIINNGFRNDWCLCHGDMGNLSILKEAAITLKDQKLYNRCVNTIESFLDYFMNEIDKESFKEDENNGFMIGLAGVGYEFLRVNREDDMPNILALE